MCGADDEWAAVIPRPVSQRTRRHGEMGALLRTSVPPERAAGARNAKRSTALERMLRGRAVVPALPTVRRDPYWQDVVKLSGSATTVTPRIVAPTRTSWPFGRVVARTGPMIGSRIGIAAILR